MPVKSARYMPTAAERAKLRLAALYAARRAKEHGIVDPVAEEKAASWRRGDLRWKLDPTQKALYDGISGCSVKQYVLEGARKIGKTFLMGCIALETAIRNPGSQVNWSAGTAKACRNTLVPILELISADAPPDCKGRYDGQAGCWRLPNDAVVQIFSAETKALCERGRGPSAVLSIVDEAGFVSLLDYLVDSIFSPQLRRVKRVVGAFVGMSLLCSTTPYTPSHAFAVAADAAATVGAYAKRTIFDSGFETAEEIEQYIAEEAAKKNLTVEVFKATSHFKREYLSERVVDTDVVVFPEWSEVREHVVIDWPRPIGFQYLDKRVSVDPGGIRDKTGILAAYFDFTAGRVIVEGERLLGKVSTGEIAENVRELEEELWGEAPPVGNREHTSRVIDDPSGRITLDLWTQNKLQCEPAIKNDRLASIGLIKTWLTSGVLIVHPRCVQLQQQLLTATTNRTKTDYERTADGHFDLCAALQYLVRGMSLTRNPFPIGFDKVTGRERPDHHPLEARQEAMGRGKQQHGLAGAILGNNPFVGRQLSRRK